MTYAVSVQLVTVIVDQRCHYANLDGHKHKDRPKVEISVSAETEITPKETTRFRPKSETETESACDLSLYPRVKMWT